MKMKQISESTIKITLLLEELEEHGMEISDFLMPQEKTEEFFYTILDELDMPENFLESGMLSFRVTPKPDRIDVFVTKSKINQNIDFEDMDDLSDISDFANLSTDDLLKRLEKSIMAYSKDDMDAVQHLIEEEKRDEARSEQSENKAVEDPAPYIYYILHFKDLKEVVDYAKMIDYPVDTSELYKLDGGYYLTVLVNIENHPTAYPTWLLARMREHANDSEVSRAVLQEHGRLLIMDDAVKNLQKVTY
ncbi:Negative regulator of genetic competence MecA [Streptococcus sp. DD10]|uniref:adaptor protein MecA n=1 Tax=Streptococcus sp. DD10 TaxID=1777878 RepID=UPI000799154F|nr:adaptor protein MecA [Streptococcus sp. DD10]KXT72461.1 Negative regulator of genetic competence MecA [Streptococcus sp. DD10]